MDEVQARLVVIRISMDVTDRQCVRLIFVAMYAYISNSWKAIFNKALARPFKLFIYEPIVQLLGLYMAFLYGLLYRMCTEFFCVCRLTRFSISYDHTFDLSRRVSPASGHRWPSLPRPWYWPCDSITNQCEANGPDIHVAESSQWGSWEA